MHNSKDQNNKAKSEATVKTFTKHDFTHLGHDQPLVADFAYCLSEAPRAKLTRDDTTACICCQENWTFDGQVTPACLACGHLICHNCAVKWFGRPKMFCPTCRAVLMTFEEALEEPNIEPAMEDEMIVHVDEADRAFIADSVRLGRLTGPAGVALRDILEDVSRWLHQTGRESVETRTYLSQALHRLARTEEEAIREP